MHESTRKWYGAADRFEPLPDHNYSWVWEYAQFRFQWACGNSRYLEEKAITLFKLVLSIAGGYGAVISFLISRKVSLTFPCYALGIVALVALAASAVALLVAFDPLDHLYPIEEEAALDCIGAHEPNEDCKANMALAMTASIEFERIAANPKAKWLRLGLGASCASIVLFILALSYQVQM